MPANVQVQAYGPQEAVLDRCAVVLGHGGFNTTMAALPSAGEAVDGILAGMGAEV